MSITRDYQSRVTSVSRFRIAAPQLLYHFRRRKHLRATVPARLLALEFHAVAWLQVHASRLQRIRLVFLLIHQSQAIVRLLHTACHSAAMMQGQEQHTSPSRCRANPDTDCFARTVSVLRRNVSGRARCTRARPGSPASVLRLRRTHQKHRKANSQRNPQQVSHDSRLFSAICANNLSCFHRGSSWQSKRLPQALRIPSPRDSPKAQRRLSLKCELPVTFLSLTPQSYWSHREP